MTKAEERAINESKDVAEMARLIKAAGYQQVDWMYDQGPGSLVDTIWSAPRQWKVLLLDQWRVPTWFGDRADIAELARRLSE